jgi:dihydroneopterin aldolase
MTRAEGPQAFVAVEPASSPLPVVGSVVVFVRGLALEAEIGLYPHERGRPQPLVVDVEATLADAEPASLADSLDYDAVVAAARALCAGGHIDLVETFARRLAAACLAHPTVASVVVSVEKPQAVPGARAAGVRIAACKRAI